jgi:GPH family glycoside/pentoside/hexuronide:cation symporter
VPSVSGSGITGSPVPETLAIPADVHVANLSALANIGFSLGMVGDRIFRDAPALLLLIYMTNYLAIPPALAGLAIFVPKIIIVFVDPIVGSLSDRLRTPWGRRRPPMFLGAILASASMVMFFHVPRLDSAVAQAMVMSVLVLIGFTGYSLFSVPYLTMASEIVSGERERRKVMAYRVSFMAIGLSVSAFAGGFVQALGGGIHGYAVMSWAYGGLCLVTMLATFAATGKLPTGDADGPGLSLPEQFRLVAKNRRYLALLLVSFAQKVGEGVGYGSFAYFCIYVVRQPLGGIGLVVLASMAGQMLAQPLWLRAARRWSDARIYTLGVLGWCLNLGLWLAMKDQSTLWLIPLGLQAGLSAGGFLTVTLSMLSSVLAKDADETGVNREGLYSGVWLGAEKLGFALGALIVGVLLAAFGFAGSSEGTHAAQSTTAIFGIAFTYCGVNMVIYLSSILAVRRFARLR